MTKKQSKYNQFNISSLPPNSGFITPDNYFENFENKILTKLVARKLKQKAPITGYMAPDAYFDSIEDVVVTKLKATAFQVPNKAALPDNYFDTIEDNVISKIKNSQNKIRNKSILVKIGAPLAIAASILFFVFLNTNTNNLDFNSLSTAEITEFVETGSLDIDAYKIAPFYDEINLGQINASEVISEEDYLNYLQDADIEQIIYEN